MVTTTEPTIKLQEEETENLLNWAATVEHSKASYFEKAQILAQKLGAHWLGDGLTQIGFWTPKLTSQVMRRLEIFLEVLIPIDEIDLRADQQVVRFHRTRLNLKQQGEYHWGVVAGMEPGSREQVGSFYWLRYIDQAEKLQAIRDPLAYSIPYGVFGPAELYDIETLQAQRPDLEYFSRRGTSRHPTIDLNDEDLSPLPNPKLIPRVRAPKNILQLHVGTATAAGTFEGLTSLYSRISDKLAKNIPLTPIEENYIGYGAVQLLPTEPPIEFRDEYSPESEFFAFMSEDGDTIEINLSKPDTQDWGYDVPILGSSTTNPAMMGSRRPDEVVDFIATLHNFSTGPIQVIYDIVYGHADNQSELLLNRQFLKGQNMYGQDLNHQLPTVRAILLEMQRRKMNTGVDGIRIDGGQDFRFFNPLTGLVEQDDAYLLAMSDVVQDIGGYQRLLFTIFEDGRPWPEEGWEEISTYRDLIELRPDSFQWGPLIFAHNTPTLKGFWERKWKRVCEVMYQGENWITGCANHDTVRRGNQVDLDQEINWNLGKTLSEVLHNGYDNPAVTLWVYGFSPGLPMDFINATTRAPWMFFRNTDERYGVKVVAEEMGFLDWQITPELYQRDFVFSRLKSLGFEDLEELKQFGNALQQAMIDADYSLPAVLEACQACLGYSAKECKVEYWQKMNHPEMLEFLKALDIIKLKEFALKFMEDCYEICNVSHYGEDLNGVQTNFNLQLRRFRHDRIWLRQNLMGTDQFNKIGDQTQTVFYGVRGNPYREEDQVVMVAHTGGEPMTVTVGDWLELDLSDWKVAIASPGVELNDNLASLKKFELKDSQGVLLVPQKSQK
ncbi:MAG: alpha-amylase [Arthrospira sp. SH-MAG29]|nr:glucosylglycerol hydrolase [Arthrospira sp. SH-MAG29]MBS0014889.1 alpha-amylase [Arthrospira sp. SH-MAG29]